ncbi:glycosyltransferase family 2 protein [Carboxylicivirga sp. M1479]|uniref:glycosyltransferase family 2 protein n=1 Tax=Carboxylicivirga sp. M1479 TaxID=2594476 RepID=UPI001178948E|nr:glycosyltransferase family 2 protein [Carboxylicivirga sp. M1479]TRX70549.1 glycosyltransferase [Carboxylicivirga sp. M1479]
MELKIKLSVITVNLNNVNGLRKTLDSVARQTFANYEHLIIDGGSSDGSIDVIKKYKKRFNGIENGLYWVSETDKGIFNAMNKGIRKAKGEYCLFLNSGDWLLKKDAIFKMFENSNGEDIVYADILTDKNERWTYPNSLSFFYFINNCIGHPATFHKRDLFEKNGLYNENLKITSDYNFFITAIVKNNATYRHVSLFFSCFDTGGISLNNVSLKESEKRYILQKHFPDQFDDIITYRKNLAELFFYRSSKIIQLIKKIQLHKFYKKIRKNNF